MFPSSLACKPPPSPSDLGVPEVCPHALVGAVHVPYLDLAVEARREEKVSGTRKEPDGIDTLWVRWSLDFIQVL